MMHDDYHRIERALHFLDAHAEEQPGLAAIAAHLGLSEFHFQRMFREWTGVTPKDFLQQLTLVRARRLLAESASLFDASLAVGLSGTSRLHDLFTGLEAMTPGEYKRAAAGLAIAWGCHPTPMGDALIAVTDRGVCGFAFVDAGRLPAEVEGLRDRWPGAHLVESPERTRPVAEEVSARMRGAPMRPLSLLLKGSPFQLKVWEALLAIPEGQVTSYQGLAELAKAPLASRAVGSAMAANPLGYLIPCHRVIRSTGVVGDYRWGSQRKERLLALEGSRRAGPPSRA